MSEIHSPDLSPSCPHCGYPETAHNDRDCPRGATSDRLILLEALATLNRLISKMLVETGGETGRDFTAEEDITWYAALAGRNAIEKRLASKLSGGA